MKLVTIFTSFVATDAQLVCARLEAAGFHPFIANENAASYLGGFSTATTMRLQVPEDEADEAGEFLEASNSSAE